MATYKRRVVYMADEEWVWLTERASSEGLTVSSLIRKRVMPYGPAEPISPRLAEEVRRSWADPTSIKLTHVYETDRLDTQPVRAVPKKR